MSIRMLERFAMTCAISEVGDIEYIKKRIKL